MATTKQPKPVTIDTRKSGPLGYKALQYANQAGYETPENLLDYINQNVDFNYTSDDVASTPSSQDKTYIPSQLGVGEDIGQSRFDEAGYNAGALKNYQDIRAENQPWIAQAVAGIAKGAILAGTTFIDGTAGLLDGIYTFANEGRISGIWDNPVTQAMAEINEWSEKELPNYYTSYQQEGPWYTPSNLFSANTIFDKMVKNFGFMIGAAYSGGVYAKLLSKGAQAMGAIKSAGTALKGGTEITKKAMTAGAKAMEASNATRSTKALIGAFMNAEAEGTVEAVSNSNEWVKNRKQYYDDLIKQELKKAQEEYLLTKGQSLVARGDGNYVDPAYEKFQNRVQELQKAKEAAYQQIEKDRTKMGNADLAFNLPILWLGDLMTFGKMYAGGWKAARNQAKTTTKATKQALAKAKADVAAGDKDAIKELNAVVKKAKQTGYQGLTAKEKALVEEVAGGFSWTSPLQSAADMIGKKTGATYRAIRQPLKEGNEEMSQSAAATAAGSYYNDDVDNIYAASLDPDATQKTLSWMSAIGNSVKETYTDINKYEEGFIGAITGFLGSPTFGKSSNNTDQTWLGKGKMLGLTGGVIADVRDYLKDREDADLTAAHITKTLKDPNFKNRYKHFVAQTRFEENKNRAVINDDEKEYKDNETASIFEDIMYFKKGDRLDLLQNALNNTELFEDADIEEIVQMVSSQRSALNEHINDDIKTKSNLQAQLDAATEQHEQHFGQEADEKAYETYKELLSNHDDSASEFYQQYNTAKQESESQLSALQQEIQHYEDRIGNSVSLEYSPYMKSDGTIMSDDEVKADIKKRVSKVNDIINDISKAQDEIDNATGGAYTDEQLTTLTWYKVMMRDWEKRASKMAGGLKDFVNLALNNPQFAQSIQAIDDFLNHAESLGLSREMVDIYGGRVQATKKFLKFGESLSDILNQVSTISEGDENTDEGRARYGIALARHLASDKKVPVETSPVEVNEETGETKEAKTEEVTLGKYLMDSLTAFIDANPAYTEDQKAPLKKALQDLARVGESYSQYSKLLDEYRKNPDKIDKAHRDAEKKAEAKITNKKAKTIAERFNWDAPIGDLIKTLDANEADIESMGGLQKFINSLPAEQRQKVKNAQKLRDAINSMNDYIDESDLEDNLKNIAKALVDAAVPNATDLQSLATALQDSLNDGAIQKMADSLIDQDTDERIKDEFLQKSEEDLAAFFNDKIKKIADALDKIDKQTKADEAREKQLKEGKTPKERKEPTADEVPEEGEPDAEKVITKGEPKDINVPKEGEPKDINVPKEGEPKDSSAPKEKEPNIDDSMYQENEKTTRQEWAKQASQNKDAAPVSEGSKGYERRRQISEYYIHGFDQRTYLQFLLDNPGYIPTGVDKDAFLQYIEKTHEYLKKAGAFEYVRTQLKEGDKITFTTDPQLNTDAGTNVVLMTVESRTEKNADGTPKIQVIGSIRSELDFQAYKKAVEKDPTKKNKAVEAQELLYNTVLNDSKLSTTERTLLPVPDTAHGGTWEFEAKNAVERKKGDTFCYMGAFIQTTLEIFEEALKAKIIHGITIGRTDAGDKFITVDNYEEAVEQLQKKGYNSPAELANVKINETVEHSPIITEVGALMAGELPLSYQENSLEEIYGNNVPIVGICLNGQVTSGKAIVDSNIVQPSGEDGQIYVLLPANNGAYIPALCYSTPINSLGDNDWYMQQSVDALLQIASSAANISHNIQEFKKWVPLKDLHINFAFSIDKDGKTIWNQTDDKDRATAIQIKFVNKEGKKITRTLSLHNGELREESARDFIRTWSKKIGLTTTLNKNRLNDEEYIKHMARYIHTNLSTGEFGQHTKDDWFTYTPTDIEEKYEAQSKKASPADPKNDPPSGKPAPAVQKITYKGQEYQVNAAGTVSLNGSIITDSVLAQSVRDALNNTVLTTLPIDLGKPKSNGNSAFAAFASSPSISGLGGKSPRRGAAKLMEATQEKKRETLSDEQQLAQAIQITKKLFPNLNQAGRIVIVNGIINTFDENNNPVEAFGAFKDGILYLSDKSPKGTTFHEAFHYVTDFLLNDKEKERMFELAKEQYGDLEQLELEEKLAEAFRAYMNGYRKPSLSQRLKMFFQNLANVIFGVSKDTHYLDTLFYNMARGNLANRKEKAPSSSKFSQTQENEMQSIKDNAIKDGTFMKAPNGKSTNLNERQWLQVRTKAFKEWFGDWEKDPANASKVVDTNGEPLVVYRGTRASSNLHTTGTFRSEVIFTTPKKVGASRYGEPIALFMNAKNPAIIDYHGEEYSKRIEDEFYEKGDGFSALDRKTKNAIKKGYDALIIKNVKDGTNYSIDDYAVMGRNQIKSATDNIGTFSKTDNNIKFMKKDGQTPIKPEFKGKLVFAQSGTGKSTIADNTDVIDADVLLGEIFGVDADFAKIVFTQLSQKDKELFTKEYFRRIQQALQDGKTVLTSSPTMLSSADVIVYNASAKVAAERTSSSERSGSNNFYDEEYHKNTLSKIEKQVAQGKQTAIKLESTQYLADAILEDASFKKEKVTKKADTLQEACTQFLSNFSITINELEDYNGDTPLFDALNRVINAKDEASITEGTGYAVAFMMQHTPVMQELIAMLHTTPKSIRRAFKRQGAVTFSMTKKEKNSLDLKTREKYLKEIGKDIANELSKLYGKQDINTENNWLKKIWKAIIEFLEIMNPQAREKLDTLSSYTKIIAEAIARNQKNVVAPLSSKPGTVTQNISDLPVLVNVEQALKENPYEASIVENFQEDGIYLAGSAAIASQGTLYRPAENPLHDLDFLAVGQSRESLQKLLDKKYPYNTFIRNVPGSTTQTFLILDRPFYQKRITEGVAVNALYDAATNEKIGTWVGSELVLNDGVKGKFLDFFCEKTTKYGTKTVKVNGKDIVFSAAENAFDAKVTWQREKDIWDYNRFKPSSSNQQTDSFETALAKHRVQKFSYENLSQEEKDYLSARKIPIEEYEHLSTYQQEILLHCL